VQASPVSFRLLAAILLGVVLSGGGLRAQDLYYEAYDRGLQAYQSRSWSTARQLFERALQLDPRQSRNKRFVGMRFGVYVPQFYLAVIAVEERRYQDALALFDAVQRAGLVKAGDSEFKTLTTHRAIAEAAIKGRLQADNAAAAEPASKPAPEPPRITPRAAEEVAKPTVEPKPPEPKAAESKPAEIKAPVPDRPAPTPPGAERTATPSKTPAAPAPPPAVAATATADIQRFSGEAQRSLQAGAYDRAWATAARIAALPGGAAAANDMRAAIRARAMEAGQQQLARNDIAAATAVSATLSRLAPGSPEAEGLRTAIGRRREEALLERAAFRSLLLGEYQQLLEAASPRLQPGQSTARLLFFAACGRAALALNAAPDRRPAMVEDARRLYQQAVQLGGTFSREEPFISPAILDSLTGRPSSRR
jgi:hypothetical protein